MQVVAYDTETALIRPGQAAPPITCVTWQCATDGVISGEPFICWWKTSKKQLEYWLGRDDIMLVGHNIAFDMAVICAEWPDLIDLVFAKYDKDLVTDTMLRQQLLDIAAGCFRGRLGDDNRWIKYNYGLDDCIHRVRGSRLKKDGWRMFYSYFRNYPLTDWESRAVEVQEIARQWLRIGSWPEPYTQKDLEAVVLDSPQGARIYPLEDARATLEVYLWQERHNEYLADQFRQARAYFALHLSSVWGLRTDGPGVDKFEQVTREEYEETQKELIQAGLVRADGTRNMKAAMQAMQDACERLGLPLRLTDGGKPSLEKDACDAVEDEVIQAYSSYQTLSKILSNDIPMLRSGTIYPIHPHYGLADTGRATCTSPNIQALRRKRGIREAFVPRPGKVFPQGDYEGLELHTLAQVCLTLLGQSELAKALNNDIDPHSSIAASILGITYEEAMRRKKLGKKGDPEFYEARQAGKVVNFGCPVGLGPDSLVLYARKTYGVILTRDKAVWLKNEIWFKSWPEMPEYFSYVARLCDGPDQRGSMEQLFVKRFRGNGRYTSMCSSFSQGLGADVAKQAMWNVAQAQYVDRASPLYGSRTVAFVHDEIIVEADDNDYVHEAAQELGKLMVQAGDRLLPDVPLKVEPQLMAYWSKDAVPVYDENKRLQVWGR